MHEVQAAYDPNHVFQRLVPGGQKLPPGSTNPVRTGDSENGDRGSSRLVRIIASACSIAGSGLCDMMRARLGLITQH